MISLLGEKMVRKIAFVSCVSKKADQPQPARDLYISDWFKKASRYAEKTSDQWYILSAKHGILEPDKEIAPYEKTLNDMGVDQRRSWAADVARQLEEVLQAGDQVILLAGQRYREFLLEPLRILGCDVKIPMRGMRIGEQLSWLKEQLEG
jgi:cytoplasmic iron level regulating protein YaaA (DUF328/UPF0246 family)